MRGRLGECLPPPRVKPPTPTPSMRPPTTLRPLGTRYEYISVQVSPAPISTVSSSSLRTMSLKRAIEMRTPGVDEKQRLALCPEHLTAKGVRVMPSSRTCGTPGQLSPGQVRRYITNDRAKVLCCARPHRARGYLCARINPMSLPRIEESLRFNISGGQ